MPKTPDVTRRLFATLWGNLPLRWKGLAVIAVPLLPLAVVVLLVTSAVSQQREANASVARALVVKAEIAALAHLFSSADTGIRGYLLTRTPHHLELVNEARLGLAAPLQHLTVLLTDLEQREHLARVLELSQQRPITELLEFAERNDVNTPVPDEILTASARVMREIHAELAAMQRREDVVIAERVALAQEAENRLVTASLGGLAVGAIASLALTLAFTHGVARRIAVVRSDAVRLAAGHPITTPGEGQPQDEVGQLAQALSDASALLQHRQHEVDTRVRELEDARGELSQFFDLSLDLLCIAGFDGRFRRVNRACEAVLGWTSEELVGVPFISLVHPDDVAATNAEAERLVAGQTTLAFENRYRCRGSGYRWLSWKAMGDPSRQLIYAAARDVTIEKQLKLQQSERLAELAALNAAADRANRAKSDFISRMSHDFRTPLNAILGFAQVLASDPLTEAQKESVQLIQRGGEHLLQLINEVLDIARIEAGQLSLSVEPVDVSEVVQHAVELIAPLAEARNIAVTADYSGGTGRAVLADRQRLNQLLMNLLSNAVKYNRHGGRISINFEEVNERLRIHLADTGRGIAPEKLGLLFKPFERLGAEATGIEGTGLGLTFSRALAEAMGGAILVTSEVGRGSTFSVELARTVRPAAAGRDAEQDVPYVETSAAAGTVLYIEDNPSNVRLMHRIVQRRRGVILRHAPTGMHGIAAAAEFQPGLILLDLHLPDISGEEVLRRLHEDATLRQIPVAVLTADATSEQARRLRSLGAIAYLTKPLDIAKVLRLLDAALGQHDAALLTQRETGEPT